MKANKNNSGKNKEPSVLESILESIREEERDNTIKARKRVINYYIKKAPLDFFTGVGLITILILPFYLFSIDNPKVGFEGIIMMCALVNLISFICCFIKDIIDPTSFTES